MRLRPELGREILGAPGQPDQPRALRGALAPKGAGQKQSRRALDRHGDDLDMPLGQPGDRLVGGELGIGVHDRGAALGLRQQDGVGPRRHDRLEIGIDEAAAEPIDAHADEGTPRQARRLRHEGGRARARRRLAVRRNRILQVHDHGVGAAAERLVELPAAVGGHEQERAHQRGRIRIRACRRHCATSRSS